MAKKKTFTVQVKINVWLDMQLGAQDLEGALEAARKLGVRDVIEIDDAHGYNDGEINVTGVYE
jgi:hypothetical protein